MVSAREASLTDLISSASKPLNNSVAKNISVNSNNGSTSNASGLSPTNKTNSNSANDNQQNQANLISGKPNKPILMCFICKLSFGNTKSFSLHANSEHQLNLQESEKLLLSREFSSAIIQRNNDEKPQISFLEPLEQHPSFLQQAVAASAKQQQMINDFVHQIQKSAAAAAVCESNNKNSLASSSNTVANNSSSTSLSLKSPSLLMAASSGIQGPIITTTTITNTNTTGTSNPATNNNTNNSVLTSQSSQSSSSTSPSSSLQPTLSANTPAAAAAKLLSEFLQQQQQQFQQAIQCPDHQGVKGVDCKSCEMLNIGLRSPLTPSKSPSGSSVGELNLTSPTASTPLPASSGGTISGPHLNLSPGAPSFTIGACPDHINGRPIGVDCSR